MKMNRIEEKMRVLKETGKKAFITYTTAGLPNMETSEKIMFAQEEAGIDVMEIGVPFSDPVADGPVIQDASYEAILNGATLEKIFQLMKDVRSKGLETPIVFMMYYNTVYHYGLKKFTEQCAACGVDGVIIPDLPYEEQSELQSFLDQTDNATILIQLISPVSKQRIPILVNNTKGFVYCVSQMGVTGGTADFHKNIREYLTSVKKISPVPVMMGFGIKTPEDIQSVRDIIDGAIVGSHFIKLMRSSNYSTDAVKKYIREFKENM